MSNSSLDVLYDAPGPRAKARNAILSVAFAIVLLALLWWLLSTLNSKGELAGDKWKPFLRVDVWTTYLLPGLLETLKAAALSLVIAFPVGVLLALGRMSDHTFIRAPSAAIVEFFRAIPVLLLMVFAKQVFVMFSIGPSDVRGLLAVVTGLVLYNSSVLAEIVRAGMLSVPRGQSEASMAIGLRKGQMMRIVLLPQAFAAMLPAIVSQLVIIVKDTALGGQLTIAAPELLRTARTITANFQGTVVATYTVIAAIYILVNFLISQLAAGLEARMRTGRRGRGKGAGSRSVLALNPVIEAEPG